MGGREIAHTIWGRGHLNHFLFSEQRPAVRWLCEAGRTTAGRHRSGEEAELGSRSSQSCLSPPHEPSLALGPSGEELRGQWPQQQRAGTLLDV